MQKVYVVSKVFFYSEEDHDSEVVAVCSSELLAKEFIKTVSRFLSSESKIHYYYEDFNLI